MYRPNVPAQTPHPLIVFWHGGRWSSGDKDDYRFVGAALAALDPRYFVAAGGETPRLAGVIGLSGAYDFLPLTDDDVKDMMGPPANYPLSQPINFVHAGAPAMLLVHGLGDETVWPKNSRNLAAALRARGVPVTLRLYPKLGHGDTVAALSVPARNRAPTLADIVNFVGGAMRNA